MSLPPQHAGRRTGRSAKPDGFVGLEPASYFTHGPAHPPYLRNRTPLFTTREDNVEVFVDNGLWDQVKSYAGQSRARGHAQCYRGTDRADENDAPLKANSSTQGEWERFRVVDADSGRVTLRALSNGQYAVAWANRLDNPVLANSSFVGAWEKLQWIDLGDRQFSLKAASNGRYLRARPDEPDSPVKATSDREGEWERFSWEPAS